MLCEFHSLPNDGKYRHECRRCGRVVVSLAATCTAKCRAARQEIGNCSPPQFDAPPESERRKAICRACSERPDGCWKAVEYDCQKKYRAAERRAVISGSCPLDKWATRAGTDGIVPGSFPIPNPQPHVPLPCPACLRDDPLPDPEIPVLPNSWRNDPAVRDRHIAALLVMAERYFSMPANLFGDGIVTCGEGKYWPGIVVMVRLLRELGCALPVQIWHNGPIGNQLDGDPLTTRIDARKIQQEHPARTLRGWEIKTYALMHSGFRRVFFIDADAYFVADPTPLFGLLDATPFAFWKDLHHCVNNVHWAWLGLDRETGQKIPPIQGGQLLIDVSGFWREMMLAHWMCQHSDYFFGHFFGDQDAWRAALQVTGGPYRMIGDARWNRVAFVCSHDGPRVVHRCRAKLFGRQPTIHRTLPLEARMLELYRSLVAPNPPEAAEARLRRLRMRRQTLLGR